MLDLDQERLSLRAMVELEFAKFEAVKLLWLVGNWKELHCYRTGKSSLSAGMAGAASDDR